MLAAYRDLKYAVRSLANRPLYAALTVLILALAMGANTTVFSVFNGLYLRPLPYADDERLVVVYNTYTRSGPAFAGTSIPDYLDRREHAGSLEDLAIYTSQGAPRTLGDDVTPVRLDIVRASPSLFSVLGVPALHGRTFTDDEATAGNDAVIVLSHRLWTNQFGGLPTLVGSDIRIDGRPYTVIGIMPPQFTYPHARTDAWVPFTFSPSQVSDDERGNEFSSSIGRLRPGASSDQLEAELDAIIRRNAERLDAVANVEAMGFTGRAQSLRDFVVGDLKPALLLLQASVLALLLIACSNVANLQLARMAARRQELMMRAVLGARATRLSMLVLCETVVVATAGALLGLVIAHAGLELVRALGLDRADDGFTFGIDFTVLSFSFLTVILAAVVAALLPMLMLLREAPAAVIQESGRIGGGGRSAQRFRGILVVVQLGMSVTLLVAAGLLIQGFYTLQRSGTGFEPDGVLTGFMMLPETRYAEGEAQARFFESALGELRALPGVGDAAYVSVLPFSGNNMSATLQIDGYEPPDGTAPPHADIRIISDRYFETLGIPVVRGRAFGAFESEPVAIVDDNFARRYWPDGDVLGQRVRFTSAADDAPWYTIVGIVPAVKHSGLTDDATKETVYWPYHQVPVPWGGVVMRTTLPPDHLIRPATDAIAHVDAEVALYNIKPMTARVAESLGPQRAPMVLTVVFAAIAFTLAVVGIYGILSWAVTQRYGELGVRMALGARSSDVRRLVLLQGTRLIAIGVAAGVILSAIVAHGIVLRLPEAVPPESNIVAIVTIAAIGLAGVALLASWIPALRASRIDPVRALGYQ